jgi:hypothetical protein
VAERRKIRNEFNKCLGNVDYVHIEREKVTQIVVYPKRKTVYVTIEPNIDTIKKLKIVKLIKEKTLRL